MQLINRKSLRSLTCQLLDLLMTQEDGRVASGLRVEALSECYSRVHGAPPNPCEYGFLSLSELLKSLPYLVEVSRSLFCLPVLEQMRSRTGAELNVWFLAFRSCTMSKTMTAKPGTPPVVVARSA